MMTKRLPFLIVAAAVMALFAAGCKQDDTSAGNAPAGSSGTTPATAASDKKPLKLAFVTNGTSDFWSIARAGVKKATTEDPTLTVDFREIQNGTPAEQREALDDLTANGTQGIAISVKDPATQTQMINDAAKKAMIFTQDSDAPDTNRACYVGTNNFAAGQQAGAEIKKACPQGGKIMFFVGSKDAENAKDRINGALDALKGSNIASLDVRTDDGDRSRAKANVADAIVAHPDLVCLVGIWSINGPAIHNALKDAGKLGKIKIVCFDEEDETLLGVKDGSISATIVQQPFEFGYQGIKLLAAALRGDKSGIPAGRQVFVPTKVINKDNVDEFWANLKKETGKS